MVGQEQLNVVRHVGNTLETAIVRVTWTLRVSVMQLHDISMGLSAQMR